MQSGGSFIWKSFSIPFLRFLRKRHIEKRGRFTQVLRKMASQPMLPVQYQKQQPLHYSMKY